MMITGVELTADERDLVLFALGAIAGQAGYDSQNRRLTSVGVTALGIVRKISNANFSPSGERIETTTVKGRPKGKGKKSN